MSKQYTYAYIFANRESMVDYWKNVSDQDIWPTVYGEVAAIIRDYKNMKVTLLIGEGDKHFIYFICPDDRPDWLFQSLTGKQLTTYAVMNGEEWTAQEINYMNSRIRNPCGRDIV